MLWQWCFLLNCLDRIRHESNHPIKWDVPEAESPSSRDLSSLMAVAVDVETILSRASTRWLPYSTYLYLDFHLFHDKAKRTQQGKRTAHHNSHDEDHHHHHRVGLNICFDQAGPAPAQHQLLQNNPTNQLSGWAEHLDKTDQVDYHKLHHQTYAL